MSPSPEAALARQTRSPVAGTLLTTRELARALGVSESSVKRWADDGELRASRTVGGHRRIPLAEAIRFVRDRRLALARAELLGLADVAALQAAPGPVDDAAAFEQFLLAGDDARARGLLQSLYLSGTAVAAILDGPLRRAMERVGELWHCDPDGILLEHRATEICAQALHGLRALLPEAAGAPVAAGGALEGDPYVLASLAAATALAAEGYRAVNLGAATPVATLAQAPERLGARLLWVSVSSPPEPDRVPEMVATLARAVARYGASVVAGGAALVPEALPRLPNLHSGRSMAELAAFARGLASAARLAGGGTAGEPAAS